MSETTPEYRANADTGDEQAVPFPPPAAGPSGTIYRLDLDEHASYVLIPNADWRDTWTTIDGEEVDGRQVTLQAWEQATSASGMLLLLPTG